MLRYETSIETKLHKYATKHKTKVDIKDGVYSIADKHLKLSVILVPKWVGIELDVFTDENRTLHYFTDTDNYDVSNPKEAWLREVIAKDIEAVLDALIDEKVLVGSYKNHAAMILPLHDQVVRVHLSRFATSAKYFESIEDARAGGSFSSLKFSV